MHSEGYLGRHMNAVARRLLGEPNRELSTKKKPRFGSHDSMAIDLEKGTFYDHENGNGGGGLQLIARETGHMNGAAFDWLRDELAIQVGDKPDRERKVQPKRRIVAVYDYKNDADLSRSGPGTAPIRVAVRQVVPGMRATFRGSRTPHDEAGAAELWAKFAPTRFWAAAVDVAAELLRRGR